MLLFCNLRPVAVRRNSSVGGKKQTRRHRAPRLPGASWTTRRGYYGARAFLRGGPIGGPLSRDDCNTFGAAYNIGTRGPPISVSVPAGPSLRAGLVARPTGRTRSGSCRAEAAAPDSTVAQRHTRKGGHPTVPPLYPHLAALSLSFSAPLRWRIWILVNGIATDLRPGPFAPPFSFALLFPTLHAGKRDTIVDTDRNFFFSLSPFQSLPISLHMESTFLSFPLPFSFSLFLSFLEVISISKVV